MSTSQPVSWSPELSRSSTVAEQPTMKPSSDLEKKKPTPDDPDDPYLVTLEGNENPQNWSPAFKWYLTMVGGLLVLNATFASSAPSGVLQNLAAEMGFGREVATLTIAIFVAGYVVGPILWGPLSENYGRRPIFIWTFIVYALFQMACALAQNTASILIFRFIGGVFAAAPLTNSGALISDIWDAKGRGKALAVFTLAPFAGPAIGPVVAGYITVAGVNWRILFWVLFGFAGICAIQVAFTIPETYAPTLLANKAARKRKETGDERYYSLTERQPKKSWGQKLENILARPFKMLAREPMLAAITAYMSFVYGCIYLLFEAFPIVFTIGHHMNEGVSGLMYLPLPIGGAIAVGTYLVFFYPRFSRAVEQAAFQMVAPELRLEMAMVAGPIFAGSFFWFAWTSFPSVSFWAPLISVGFMGFSICLIFLSLFTYIIDVYLFAAASALAGSTVVRSLFGAVFPLFATQMYEGLGAEWASSLVGFIALLLMPIPFVLYKFGPALRQRSRYAPSRPNPTVKEEERDMQELDRDDPSRIV